MKTSYYPPEAIVLGLDIEKGFATSDQNGITPLDWVEDTNEY